jgi:hypothetical protein
MSRANIILSIFFGSIFVFILFVYFNVRDKKLIFENIEIQNICENGISKSCIKLKIPENFEINRNYSFYITTFPCENQDKFGLEPYYFFNRSKKTNYFYFELNNDAEFYNNKCFKVDTAEDMTGFKYYSDTLKFP